MTEGEDPEFWILAPYVRLGVQEECLDVLRFLGGFGAPRALNRRVGLWTHDLAVDGQEVPRFPECATCGDEAIMSRKRSG